MAALFIYLVLISYALALLQNSFLSHFTLFGAVPELVFALFYVLVFFTKRSQYLHVVAYAFITGFFLDLFSYHNMGESILTLCVLGLLAKRAQDSLKESNLRYPSVHFIPLFIGTFLVYSIVSLAWEDFSALPGSLASLVSVGMAAKTVYTLVFAIIGFYVYKKLQRSKALS